MSDADERRGRIRGLKALIHDAVDFTVDRVEDGHAFFAKRARQVLEVLAPELTPFVDGVELVSSTVPLATVRAVNRLIERGTDPIADLVLTLGPWLAQPRSVVPMRSDITGGEAWLADAALGALNGAVGDYLHRQSNGLDMGFALRHGDAYVSPASFVPPRRRIAVFVHGLAATEWSWCWDAAAYHGDPALNLGALLERDLAVCAIHARYNTGRRVFENGRLLADALEQLCRLDGPDATVDEIILIGHSMGGLVARAACHHAAESGQRWVKLVSRSFSLGAPHHGAPLEKLADLMTSALDLFEHPGAKIPAEILRRRSAGIRDLREGTLIDDSWQAGAGTIPEDVPLLDHIAYYFVSATLTRDQNHALGHILGDVLVRVPSASGAAITKSAFSIQTECFGGILHHQLQNHPDVCAWISRAIAG